MTCNCPESGTSGSCPFHDASTRFTVEPQPGRWDTKLGRIVTAIEDAAYGRGRVEATAAAEQRLRERIEALSGSSLQPAYMLGAEDMRKAVLALLDSDAPTPASPRQGEPEGLDVERLARAITDARRENPHLDLGGLSGDSTAGVFAAYYAAEET